MFGVEVTVGQLTEGILHPGRKLEWWDWGAGWCLRPTALGRVTEEGARLETRGKAAGDACGATMGQGGEAHREERKRPESQGARKKASFLETRRSVSRGAGGRSVRCQRKTEWRGDRKEELG